MPGPIRRASRSASGRARFDRKVSLSVSEADFLLSLGEGNLSRGISRAAAYAALNFPDSQVVGSNAAE